MDRNLFCSITHTSLPIHSTIVRLYFTITSHFALRTIHPFSNAHLSTAICAGRVAWLTGDKKDRPSSVQLCLWSTIDRQFLCIGVWHVVNYTAVVQSNKRLSPQYSSRGWIPSQCTILQPLSCVHEYVVAGTRVNLEPRSVPPETEKSKKVQLVRLSAEPAKSAYGCLKSHLLPSALSEGIHVVRSFKFPSFSLQAIQLLHSNMTDTAQ